MSEKRVQPEWRRALQKILIMLMSGKYVDTSYKQSSHSIGSQLQ